MSENAFNKSKYIPCGVITIGNSTVTFSEGTLSPNGVLKIGVYIITIYGDFQDSIVIEEKKGSVTRKVRINKQKFEQIIENAFNGLWEE